MEWILDRKLLLRYLPFYLFFSPPGIACPKIPENKRAEEEERIDHLKWETSVQQQLEYLTHAIRTNHV